MPKVPPGGRCESDEGSADGLGDGGSPGLSFDSPDGPGVGEVSDEATVREPSDSADGIPGECDGVGTGLLKKESRPLILSRIDSNFRFGMVDEAIARRR